jgi:pimeloyl-ACP methyl ester carboxylesterase
MKSTRIHRALVAAALLLGVEACMPASWGAGALLHPHRRHVTMSRPAGAEDIAVQNAGVTLRGWRFRASGPRRGTVIYLHGSADNRTSGLFAAEHYAPRGYDVVVYDSRAHGESGGEACTYGHYEKDDLRRVIDAVAPGPVALIGVSLGGAVALQAAAIDPRITTVVAISTFSDLRTVATERAPSFASGDEIEAAFRLAERTASFRVDEVSPMAAAARIAVPVLLVHGQDDRETPAAHSQRVFAALRGPKRLILVPGAGHNDGVPADVWTAIDAWIDEAVPAVILPRPRTEY